MTNKFSLWPSKAEIFRPPLVQRIWGINGFFEKFEVRINPLIPRIRCTLIG